jgi:hypothetical protein
MSSVDEWFKRFERTQQYAREAIEKERQDRQEKTEKLRQMRLSQTRPNESKPVTVEARANRRRQPRRKAEDA